MATEDINLNILYSDLEGLKFLASGAMCHVWSCKYAGRRAVIKFPREDKLQLASKDLDLEVCAGPLPLYTLHPAPT
jgi:predicted Ser/Thr protein kinase